MSERSRPHRFGAGAALIVLLAASSCTTPTQPPSRSSEPLQTIDHETVAALRVAASPSRQIEIAQAKLIAECMRAHGYRYPLARVVGLDSGMPNGHDLPGMVSESARIARHWGYVWRYDSGASEKAQSYVEHLSSDRQAAYARFLWGDQRAKKVTVIAPQGFTVAATTTGCFAGARRELFGSVRRALDAFYIPQGLFRYQTATWNDQSVERSQRSYSRCMRQSGYRVAFPQDAVQLALDHQHIRPRGVVSPSPAESRLALADAQCERYSGIVSAYEQALVRHASPWIVENREEILAVGHIVRVASQRASRLLGAGESQSGDSTGKGARLLGLESGQETGPVPAHQ